MHWGCLLRRSKAYSTLFHRTDNRYIGYNCNLLRDEAVEDFAGLVWWGGLGGGEAGEAGCTDGEAAETFVAG